MITDMAGYTNLAQANELLSLKILDRAQRMLKPILSKHHGRLVKTMGDSYLVEFESALNATKCAVNIQQRLHKYNLSPKDQQKIELRIGVHLGDVQRVKGDVLGDAVNLASRVEPLADPGGICVSEQVFDQVRNKISQRMSKLGSRSLKNVRYPMDIYKIVMPWEKGSMENVTVEPPSSQRIAVLPLTSMSPDASDEYFADGMTEEMISAISKLAHVEVISRTSVMPYKKLSKSVRDVAKELDVGTVLEGSVRKAGDQIRVAVQLIDAVRDRHIWAESYDRRLEDIFAIQSDIAKRVADALQTRIRKTGNVAIEPVQNVEAYTIYLRAMQLSHDNSGPSLREAVGLFEKAVEKEPGFARAYAGLAHALCGLASGYEDFASSIQRAESAARRAFELGPDLAESYLALAYVHTFMDKFDDVIAEASKAIEINPNLSEAYSTIGWIISSQGKLDEGVKDLLKAYKLDPLSFRPGSEVSLILQLAGKEAEALEILGKLTDLYPKNHRVYARWAEYYLIKRDYSKAQEMLNKGSKISPDDIDLRTDQGVLFADTGKREEAEKILADIQKSTIEADRLQGELFIQAALGNKEESLKALFRLAETHAWPPLIKSLPVFHEIRKDPRFSEFCLKVGLPTGYLDRPDRAKLIQKQDANVPIKR